MFDDGHNRISLKSTLNMESVNIIDWGGKFEDKRDDSLLFICYRSYDREVLYELLRKYLYDTADHIYDHIKVYFGTLQDIGLIDHKSC